MAKSKKKTKLSRFGKLARVFNISSTRGKMLVFLLSFAIVGGGYMAYRTFAARLTRDIITVWPKNNNNQRVFCLNTAIETGGFGLLAYNCLEWKSSPGNTQAYVRIGNYSPEANTFSPTSGDLHFSGLSNWVSQRGTYGSPTWQTFVRCSNLPDTIRFSGLGAHNAGAYGSMYYGYIHIKYGTWHVKPASFSWITGVCSPTGDWKPISHLAYG